MQVQCDYCLTNFSSFWLQVGWPALGSPAGYNKMDLQKGQLLRPEGESVGS